MKAIETTHDVAIRAEGGMLLSFAKSFLSAQEAETLAINNIPVNSGNRFDIIAVTRQIIKSRRI